MGSVPGLPASVAGLRRSLVLTFLVLAVSLATLPQGTSAAPGQRIDLRILLLTESGAEPAFEAWKVSLEREGVPYDVIRPNVDPPITASTLTAAADHARYQGIVFANHLVLGSLSPAERATIEVIESDFGIRRLTAFVYPSPDYGLDFPTYNGEMGGTAAQLTPAGEAVFPYLAGPIEIDQGSFGYRAVPFNPSFVTLVEGPGSSALVGVHTHVDGREELVVTFDGNEFQTQTLLLHHGLVGWLTRGVYLGHYRQYLELQVDDIFYDNDRWDPVNNTTHEDDGATLPLIRMLPSDVDRAIAWSATTGIGLDMVFNGFGSVHYLEKQRTASPVSLIDADFDVDTDDFTYLDDSFRGTSQPGYASGTRDATGGLGGSGGLQVLLGGVDDSEILGMSGGWRGEISLTAAQSVTLKFQYNLTHAANYELDEYSEVLVSVDGQLYGLGLNDYVDRIVGDGDGGTADSTGWVSFEEDLPLLGPGTHDIVIGGYNNKKNLTDEFAEVVIDDVEVLAGSDPLTDKLLNLTSDFYWINHTYEHFDLNVVGSPDPHDYAAIVGEINDNIAWAGLSGIPIDPVELVTGEHSGLARTVPVPIPENPDMAQALTETGILWIANDNSVDPTQYAVGSALTVPRHPANILYNAATQLEQLDEYNYIFFENCSVGCIPAPVDWAGYVNNEATIMFRHVATNDPRAHYVHQSNLAEDGVLYEVVDEVLARTGHYFATSLEQLTQTDIGIVLGYQQDWAGLKNSGQVTAYRLDGNVHLESTVDAIVPLTGATGDLYGGLRSDWFDLSAGVPLVIPISAGNSPPIAVDDPGPGGFSTAEDAIFVTADVTGNDYDFEDGTPDPTSVTVVGPAPPGLVNNGDGTFDYTPPQDFNGTVTFDYEVRDSAGATSNTATVTLSVTAVNDQPTATNKTQTQIYPEGAASVAIDDIVVTDPDAGELILANLVLANPSTGVLTTTGGGSYNPGTGLWTITDSVAAVNAALASVEFEPVPGNNVDTDVTVDIFDGGEDGTVGVVGLITLDVDAVNDPPTASNLNQSHTYVEDEASVALDDIVVADPDLGEMVVADLSLSPIATGTLTTSGSATYDPVTGAWSIVGTVAEVNAALATVAFQPTADNYVDSVISVGIDDGDEDGSGPLTGAILLDALGVNDVPVAVDDIGAAFNTPGDLPFTTGNVTDNDTDVEDGTPDPTTVAIVGPIPTGLTNNNDGTFHYTPPPGFTGEVSFQYQVNDSEGLTSNVATVTITNLDFNDAPSFDLPVDPHQQVLEDAGAQTVAAFATNISAGPPDEAGQVLTFAVDNDNKALFSVQPDIDETTGDLTYTPAANANGVAVVTASLSDDGGVADGGVDTSAPQHFTITVAAVNDAPVAAGDGPYSIVAGDTLVVNGVLDNDLDAEGDPLTARVVSEPARGTISLASDGSFTYVHDGSLVTSDSFAYVANDGQADSNVATVNVLITAVLPETLDADSVGLVDPATATWYLRSSSGVVTSFVYGNPGDVPLLGDWDGDGIDTPGMFRPSDGYAYLRNSNTQGIADVLFFVGNPGDMPLSGDYDGDGRDSLSLYRSSTQEFFIFDELGENNGGLGTADFSFLFGNPGDTPMVGDLDGDGSDEVGLHRDTTGFVYYRDTLTTGGAHHEFFFGDPFDRFVTGDWGLVDGTDTPAVFRPTDHTFYFRYTNTQGIADSTLVFGESAFVPVAGQFGLG